MFSIFRLKSERFDILSGSTKGCILILFAACLFSCMVALIKLCGERLHVTQILFVRQLIMSLIVLPSILHHFPGCLRTARFDLQLTRVSFALIAMLSGFYALIHLPLADVVSIGFAKAFFVTILAIWFLGERVGIRRWFAVILGFVGVLIMIRPGTPSFEPLSLLALLSSGCAGVVMIILRKLSSYDSPITILSYQAIFVGIVISVPAFFYWQAPTLYEWILLLLMGCISYFAQLLNINAYKWGEASLLASLDYTRLLYATILGFLIFDTWPDIYTWLGAFIIIFACLYTMHREHRADRSLIRSPDGRHFTNT